MQADSEDTDYSAGYSDTGVPELGAYQSKKPLRVLNEVQFSDAKEAWRGYNEDELGEEPGSYDYAEKPRNDNAEMRVGDRLPGGGRVMPGDL
jgi:hypothetical protein